MKTRNLSQGALVKNIRSGEMGILVKEDRCIENLRTDGTIYYEVLDKNGNIKRWFRNNIIPVGEEIDRDTRP
tara:strand:+ start:407 stop:622 length:216 start_codon:yes stop_codon:yes gene_type:complete